VISRDSPRLAPARLLLNFMVLVESTQDQHSGVAHRMREIIRAYARSERLPVNTPCSPSEAHHAAEEYSDEAIDDADV